MKNKVTAKMIRKLAKELENNQVNKSQNDSINPVEYVEVENPKVKTDFLRVIDKRELLNYKLVTDSEGNTKQVYVKPTLLL